MLIIYPDLLSRSRENDIQIPFSHAFCILSGLMFHPYMSWLVNVSLTQTKANVKKAFDEHSVTNLCSDVISLQWPLVECK